MIGECTLHTLGYQVTFKFQGYSAVVSGYGEFVGTSIRIAVPSEFIGITSRRTIISMHDFRVLVNYLENHIARLYDNPGYESPTYANLELGMQLRALQGNVDTQGVGEFALQCLVNVGRDPESNTNIYWGGLAEVRVIQIRQFIADLDALLNQKLGANIRSAFV